MIILKPLIKMLTIMIFFLSRWENLLTDIENGSKNATKNYHTIDWTPKRSLELFELYSSSPVGMQCQSGGGEQLSGDWTSLRIPRVKKVNCFV